MLNLFMGLLLIVFINSSICENMNNIKILIAKRTTGFIQYLYHTN